MDKSDPLDPVLNRMIGERIHADVMEAIDDSINDAKERLKTELGLRVEG